MSYIGYGGNVQRCGIPPYPPVPIGHDYRHRYHDHKGEKGDTGPQGEKGDVGPQGPRGEKGDPGTIINSSGSFNTSPVPVSGGSTEQLTITSTGFSNGVGLNNNNLRFNRAGTYLITVNVPVTHGSGGDNLHVTLSGNNSIPGIPSTVGTTTLDQNEYSDLNGSFIIKVMANVTLGFNVTLLTGTATEVQVGEGVVSAALLSI